MFLINTVCYFLISLVGFFTGVLFNSGRDNFACGVLALLTCAFCAWCGYIDARPRK